MPDYSDGRPHIVTDKTYDGCEICWYGTSDADRPTFIAAISDYADALKPLYKVATDFDGDPLMLSLDHKKPSNPTDRQILKGITASIEGDTIWGGGSG